MTNPVSLLPRRVAITWFATNAVGLLLAAYGSDGVATTGKLMMGMALGFVAFGLFIKQPHKNQ